MSNEQEYNGYTNYATWNICLWMDNDYGAYQSKVEMLKAHNLPIEDDYEARAIASFAGFPDGKTPDLDDKEVRSINWQEVAEELETERLELLACEAGN